MTTENSCGEPYDPFMHNPCKELALPGASTSNISAGNYTWITPSVGSPGQVLTVGAAGAQWSNSYTIPGVPSEEEFKNLMDRMNKIEERFAILHPNQELQDRFPALQEAYEAYKIIEKLVHDPTKGST